MASSKVVAWDVETWRMRPGVHAPPVVCMSFALIENGVLTFADVVDKHAAPRYLQHWLEQPDVLLTNAEIAFDFACMAARVPLELIFAAYENDRVTDILTRQKLLDLAAGKYRGFVAQDGRWVQYSYGLEGVAKRHCGIDLQKDDPDSPRYSYQQWDHIPISQWPQEAIRYSRNDAMAAGFSYLGQEQIPRDVAWNFPGRDPLRDQFRQARAGFCLKLSSIHGIRTDAQAVDRFGKIVAEEYLKVCQELREDGLMRIEVKRETAKLLEYIQRKKLVSRFLVRKPGTPPKISLSADALFKSGDPTLQLLRHWPTLKLHCVAEEEAYQTSQSDQKEKVRKKFAWVWEAIAELEKAGIASKKFTRNTKAAQARMLIVCRELGRQPKLTKQPKERHGKPGNPSWKPQVALDADSCRETGDPLLCQYAEASTLSKTISTDLKILALGSKFPIHTHFETIEATGRTGSSSPNIQNIRRLKGIRECFMPRLGHVFINPDYTMLELHTLAQLCLWWLGYSRLAEALNANRDPHVIIGAQLCGISYEKGMQLHAAEDPTFENFRDCGKVGNFGLPGGLSVDTFVSYAAKSYRLKMSRETGAFVKDTWFGTWTEMRDFMKLIRTFERGSKNFNIELPYSGLLRAKATYCSACNFGFQALGAVVAKHAYWLLTRECYAVPSSPLYGARIPNFIHDEFLIEVREERAREAAVRTTALMNQAGREILPDCPVKTKTKLVRRWSKTAKRLVNEKGELEIWDLDKCA